MKRTLTPRQMAIPQAVARDIWRFRSAYCRALGFDLQEMVAQGYLALVHAVEKWTPERSHDGENGYDPYLCQQTKWGIETEITKRSTKGRHPHAATIYSLDTVLSPDGELTGAALVGELDPELAGVEIREQAEEVLSWLDAQDRRVVEMVYRDGLTRAEAASAIGVSMQSISNWLLHAKAQLRVQPQFRHLIPQAA